MSKACRYLRKTLEVEDKCVTINANHHSVETLYYYQLGEQFYLDSLIVMSLIRNEAKSLKQIFSDVLELSQLLKHECLNHEIADLTQPQLILKIHLLETENVIKEAEGTGYKLLSGTKTEYLISFLLPIIKFEVASLNLLFKFFPGVRTTKDEFVSRIMSSFEITNDQGILCFNSQMCSNLINRLISEGLIPQPADRINSAEENYTLPE